MDDSERQVQLLLALETTLTEPSFLVTVEDLLSQGETLVSPGEQNLQSHLLWQQFAALMETQLQSFLESRSATESEVYEACKRVYDQDPHALTCFEYIFAAAAYEDFLEMLLTRKRMQEWSTEEETQPET